jgi:hypothetical protein
MPDARVIEIYRGLSDIEDNFKVSKSDLDIRPVFDTRQLWRDETEPRSG